MNNGTWCDSATTRQRRRPDTKVEPMTATEGQADNGFNRPDMSVRMEAMKYVPAIIDPLWSPVKCLVRTRLCQ